MVNMWQNCFQMVSVFLRKINGNNGRIISKWCQYFCGKQMVNIWQKYIQIMPLHLRKVNGKYVTESYPMMSVLLWVWEKKQEISGPRNFTKFVRTWFSFERRRQSLVAVSAVFCCFLSCPILMFSSLIYFSRGFYFL